MRQAMRLVGAGVPWDVATKMSDTMRFALVVMVGEQEGRDFDWDAMRWRPPKDA
jgi:hypothetical protein